MKTITAIRSLIIIFFCMLLFYGFAAAADMGTEDVFTMVLADILPANVQPNTDFQLTSVSPSGNSSGQYEFRYEIYTNLIISTGDLPQIYIYDPDTQKVIGYASDLSFWDKAETNGCNVLITIDQNYNNRQGLPTGKEYGVVIVKDGEAIEVMLDLTIPYGPSAFAAGPLINSLSSYPQRSMGRITVYDLDFEVFYLDYPDWITDYIELLSIDNAKFKDVFLKYSTNLTEQNMLSLDDTQIGIVIEESLNQMQASGEDVSILINNFTARTSVASDPLQSTPSFDSVEETVNPLSLATPKLTYHSLKQIPGAEICDNSENDHEIYALHNRYVKHIYKFDADTNTWALFYDATELSPHLIYAGKDSLYLCCYHTILNFNTGESVNVPINTSTNDSITDFFVDEDAIYASVMPFSIGNTITYGSSIGAHGIYYTQDLGEHWEVLSEGLDNTHVLKIKQSIDGRVFCAGSGGMYELIDKHWIRLDNADNPYICDFVIMRDATGHATKVIGIEEAFLLVCDLGNGICTQYNYPADVFQGWGAALSDDQSQLLIANGITGFSLWNTESFQCEDIILHYTCAGQDAAFYNDGFILYGGSGYAGCFFYNPETKTCRIFTDGMYSYPGFFSALVDQGSIYACSSDRTMIYDIQSQTYKMIELIDQPIMGEMFEIIKRDDYYTYEYNNGIWDLNGFLDPQLIPIEGYNSYEDIRNGNQSTLFAGGGYYITEAMDTAYFCVASPSKIVCLDWQKKTEKYTGSNLLPFQYGSVPKLEVIEGASEDTVFVSYFTDWNLPLVHYISYDSGRNFQRILEDVQGYYSLIGCYNGHSYYIAERDSTQMIQYDPNENTWEVFSDTMYNAVYAGKGVIIVATDTQVKVYDIKTKSLLALQDVEEGMKFISVSETDTSVSIVYTQGIVDVDFSSI